VALTHHLSTDQGLSLLFDSCDEAAREVILGELVKGLTSIKGTNANASGGEMATFTELSEIANNAGQPELVYKLMELSTASAAWNTRKGMAFALGEVSRERLQKHLHKLVPTLYRYTFDPNPKIHAAMKQVWTALVPEPKKTLDELLQPVLTHLAEGLNDRLWRAREASRPGPALVTFRFGVRVGPHPNAVCACRAHAPCPRRAHAVLSGELPRAG
jgi:hypothetical protein